jgi:predicted  nucleic acid-binding Zn-ribbon protein
LLQDELAKLREVTVEHQASTESIQTKLERVQLKLEGAETRNQDLERTNGELRRSNTDLQRQLDRWQSLETKGGAEVESLRKQRIELEVKNKGLQNELDSAVEERDAAIEKWKAKYLKVKENVGQWQASILFLFRSQYS